jgi:hypothetical protein
VNHFRFLLPVVVSLGIFTQAAPYVVAHDQDKDKTACTCQAKEAYSSKPSRKKHRIISGIGKDLGTSFSDMGKDLVLVFSVQDYDPYAQHSPPKGPYVLGEARFNDGTSAEIIKFPDSSLRVKGSVMDGTYACPDATGNGATVYYPNGVQGTLKRLPGGGLEIFRPDQTTTTITKNMSGSYRISNSKAGYLGDINTDSTGVNYEFSHNN